MEGIIIKGIGGLYFVRDFESGQVTPCRARGKFRRIGSPLPGDHVVYLQDVPEGSIEEIKERTNDLIRPAIANVSQAFLVFAMVDPDINWTLLNHFLLVMEQKEIRPLILLNKRDLADDAAQDDAIARFMGTGYEMMFISARSAEMRQVILDRLTDEVTVLCGPSGAGKSTLLNQLLGEDFMKTGVVSVRIGRGKHTTRHTELVQIHGGLLADTPGFSNVEPRGINYRELKDLFPEFRELQDECRFTGCLHDKEPNCAVKKEVGISIAPARYDYYETLLTKLREEDKYKWD